MGVSESKSEPIKVTTLINLEDTMKKEEETVKLQSEEEKEVIKQDYKMEDDFADFN
jgi:hypothetical protein